MSDAEVAVISANRSRWQKRESIVLQDRDYEIFIWLLDQKFSDLETLKHKFFSRDSESLGGARTRVQKLEAYGYLRSELLDIGSTKKYYIATKKAHRVLQERITFIKFPSAVKAISVLTFLHDKYVLQCRVYLEEQGRATHWKSERRLKALLSRNGQNLEREFMPDGIFTNKNGELTAFELENVPKEIPRYKKKIERFAAIMAGTNPAFSACLYVTTNENTKKILKSLTAPYGKYFLVLTFNELQEASKSLNEKAEAMAEAEGKDE